jgi:voltage-gated potassium channel
VSHNGNFTDIPRLEAVLLILLIIISVGAGASILQNTVNTVVNGELTRSATAKRLITRLKDHVIIVGYSHLGRYVSDKLGEMEYDYVVITRDKLVHDELLAKERLVVLEHSGRTMEVLEEAGIARASVVIVAHNEDSDNMLFILAARKLRPDIRIVSVIHNDALVEAAKSAGASNVIPSSVTVGHLLALSAVTEDLVGVVFSEKIGTKEIAEFSVFRTSPLIGKGLQTVSQAAAVIGVIRGGEVISNLFAADFRIREGDTLLVFGDPAKLELLEEEARAT